MNVAAHGPYTHILGSDLVYDDNSWPHLLGTLKALAHDEVDPQLTATTHSYQVCGCADHCVVGVS